MEEWMNPYIEALCKEIKQWKDIAQGYRIKSIYLGGGTPTLFSGGKIAGVLDVCAKNFNIKSDAEITIEANPGTIDKAKLLVLKRAGINRLSIGLQAWQDKHLKTLGRIHGSGDLVFSMDCAKETGFENINIDVMFGLPDQTMGDWLETLSKVCAFGIQHMSMYSLKLESGTLMHRWYRQGNIAVPTEEEDRLMYYEGRKYVSGLGLKQYEISNFAIPGKECVHNLIYWNNEEYIGCGSGAHSFFNSERFSNKSGIGEYIEAVAKDTERISFRKKIDEEDERFDTIMLGLRLVEGVNKERFKARFGKDIEFYYGDAIKRLEQQELLIDDEDSIRLTDRGMDVQNVVLLEFMD
jgi:oxygen-independent coproporphyrinogen-3 oxidase